ncbi:hypothetical protein [Bradyrhizobium elkanii]|uniref:hypothetical protein n=1 Tax=Bradyrhizobium elkanii TaxID=29448 RepID=UPI0004B4CC48|nr:hypothetical protein [Bradyrhizobium elkanii]
MRKLMKKLDKIAGKRIARGEHVNYGFGPGSIYEGDDVVLATFEHPSVENETGVVVVRSAEALLKGDHSLKKTHVVRCSDYSVAFELLRRAGNRYGFR